ncbi:THUMP domain-containing protein 2 isoform X2 [Mastacembelus armatus]|uniref:THUMP domain-containing protein 2 isoform X2 n=1 Tax=Mastacembelus armatus TaxID=205130 RepID=UPI000E454BCF|nr:THUMP domain-containing protein 2 isoform X2 [Mastacembelus armatus]
MTEPRSERGLVRYYCTAGNGMEPFLTEEVTRKLAAEDVCQIPGKVLFNSSATINRISELKAAERLFLLLKEDSPVRLSAHISPGKAATVLQSRLLDDKNQWTKAVLTWSRLQGELQQKVRGTTALGMSTEEGTGSKDQREEKSDMKTRKTTGEQMEEDSADRRLRAVRENGAHTLEKKRKREEEEREVDKVKDVQSKTEEETSVEPCTEAHTLEKKRKRDDDEEKEVWRDAARHSSSEKNVEKDCSSEKERRRYEEDERGVISGTYGMISGDSDKESICDSTTPRLHHCVDSSRRRMSDMAEDFAAESTDNVKVAGGPKTLLPSCRIKPEPATFRISCKCTGSLSRYYSTQVNVNLSDDHCLLGIPLTRLPLANRSYIKTTGLRPTVAWAISSLAQIQPGFCVVDPMCGVGTILIEAAQEHKAACFLGIDIDDGQLHKAKENIKFAELGNRIHLLKASSMVLPLPSASVDAVVCDLPFGRKFGTKTSMAANLPVIVTEMERVLCVGGTLVLLLSPQLSCLLKNLLAQKHAGPTSNQETKTHTGGDCPSPPLSLTKHQTSQIHCKVKSSSSQETSPQSELQHCLPPPLSSLKLQATVRVSLGAIDGLIHKYVKRDA